MNSGSMDSNIQNVSRHEIHSHNSHNLSNNCFKNNTSTSSNSGSNFINRTVNIKNLENHEVKSMQNIKKPNVKSIRLTKMKEITSNHLDKITIKKLKIKLIKMKNHETALKKDGTSYKKLRDYNLKISNVFNKIVDLSIYQINRNTLLNHIKSIILNNNYLKRTKLQKIYPESASTKDNSINNSKPNYINIQNNRIVKSLNAEFYAKHPNTYNSLITLFYNYPFHNHHIINSRYFSHRLRTNYINTHKNVNSKNYLKFRTKRVHQLQNSFSNSILSSMARIPYEEREAKDLSYSNAYKSYKADRYNWVTYSPKKRENLDKILNKHKKGKEYNEAFFQQWSKMQHIPVAQAKENFQHMVKFLKATRAKKERDSSKK